MKRREKKKIISSVTIGKRLKEEAVSHVSVLSGVDLSVEVFDTFATPGTHKVMSQVGQLLPPPLNVQQDYVNVHHLSRQTCGCRSVSVHQKRLSSSFQQGPRKPAWPS